MSYCVACEDTTKSAPNARYSSQNRSNFYLADNHRPSWIVALLMQAGAHSCVHYQHHHSPPFTQNKKRKKFPGYTSNYRRVSYE